jgi:transcriptional regulator with XRE-family HTH domain
MKKSHNKDVLKLASNIREMRIKKKLTQEQAALKTGVSPAYWGFIEQARRPPSFNTLLKVAKGLGCKLVELVKGL